MAFKGRSPIRSKIVINNKSIEQVKSFKYLGCEISFDGETDVDAKINRILPKSKIRSDTTIRVYNVLARAVLMYDSEVWVLHSDVKSRITAAEILATYVWTGNATATFSGN